MKTLFSLQAIAIAALCLSGAALSQNVVTAAPSAGSSTTIYRQVMPDGRVIYSDKAVTGGKVDHTITVEPTIKGNLWTTEASSRPAIEPQVERTPIRKMPPDPGSGKRKSLDEATSEVIRAEMLLEDAKKRQQEGIEPLPGERTGNSGGGSRLNEMYEARQKLLARDVGYAEAAVKKAVAERDRAR